MTKMFLKNLINFLASPFVYFKIHPNIISLLGLLMIGGFMYGVVHSHFYLAAFFVFLNGFFDTLDGAAARLLGSSSSAGTLIDRTIDKISEAIIFSTFISLGLVDLKLGLYTLSIVLIATMIASNIEILLGKESYAPLLAHLKFLKLLRFVAMIVFIALGNINLMFFIVAIVATYSVIIRLTRIQSRNRPQNVR